MSPLRPEAAAPGEGVSWPQAPRSRAVAHPLGGQPAQAGGELERRAGGAVQGGREVQLAQLLDGGAEHPLVAVAQAGDEDAGEAVQIPLPGVVLQAHPLAPLEDPGLGGELRHLPEVEHQVLEQLPLCVALGVERLHYCRL